MSYGPYGKPTTVSIERYERLQNEFNELLTEYKNLVEALEDYKNFMEQKKNIKILWDKHTKKLIAP